MFTKFGQIAPSIKQSVLRYFYCDLTGDALAANTAEEAEPDTDNLKTNIQIHSLKKNAVSYKIKEIQILFKQCI